MERNFRFAYVSIAWLFLLGVITQVFLAGLVVVARQAGWNGHIGLGHMLAGPLLLMLAAMYAGRLPKDIKRLTWLLFGVYVIQADVVVFMRASAPIASALHPVLALFDFALGWVLVNRTMRLLRTAEGIPAQA